MSITSDPISSIAVTYFQMQAKCSRLHSIRSLIIVWHRFSETENQAGEVSQWVKHLLFKYQTLDSQKAPWMTQRCATWRHRIQSKLASDTSYTGGLGVWSGDPASKNNVEEEGWFLASVSTRAHTFTYTHMHALTQTSTHKCPLLCKHAYICIPMFITQTWKIKKES